MFRSLNSKGNSSLSSSKNKKNDTSSSSRRRAESTVSSSSNRKAARNEDGPSEATASSSPHQHNSSGPSSYATAPNPRIDDRYEYGSSTRPASLTENAIRALSTQDDTWEDVDARSDRRSRVSGDQKKKHKKHRSRSDSRDRNARKEKKGNSDKVNESSRNKRRLEEAVVNDRALDSPKEISRGYDSFDAQVGASSFSQFPGQYNEPTMGPPSPYHRPDMSSHIRDQFPGQDPIQYSTPAFRPGKTVEEGGFGLAADFYNDQGQSVSSQPGVRPESATIITGTQPHLMTASTVPTTPLETGHGSAADFYGSSSMYDSAPSNPSKPNKPPKPSSFTANKPSKLNKPDKTSSSSATLASGTAAAALGYATSSLHQHSHSDSQQPNSMSAYPPSINTQQTSQDFSHNQYYHSTSEPAVPTNSSYYAPPTTSRPSQLGKSSSQSQNSLYAATGAAGLAAGAYGSHEYQNHQQNHQTASYNISETRSASYYSRPSPSPYLNGNMAMKHGHPGPVSKFVNWWQDHEDVRKMEEYTEFIGVCRYCFDPRTSVADAPRRHNFDRRRSSDTLRRRSNESMRKACSQGSRHSRVDKDSRYHSSDNERRKKKSSWLGAGLAGYGLAKMGGALWNKDFDDTYSVKSGKRNDRSSHGTNPNRSRSRSADRRSHSERGVIRGGQDHEYVYVRTKDGSVVKQRVPSDQSRSHSKSRKDGFHEVTTAAALGTAASRVVQNRSHERSTRGAFVRTNSRNRKRSPHEEPFRRRERSRSRSYSPGLGEILGLTSSKLDRTKRGSSGSSYVDVSHDSNSQRSGMFGGFFSSHPEKKRREHHKKKKGFFTFANSSASSSNSDLAFGHGFTKQRQNVKKTQKTQSDEHLNATLLGIGATAAALAAAQSGRKQSRRMPEVVAGRERRSQQRRRDRSHDRNYGKHSEEEDGWESASEFNESGSVSSGLAFGDFDNKGKGPADRSSIDSLTSQSSGTNKWGWRWGGKSEKKTQSSQTPSLYHSEQDRYVAADSKFPSGPNGVFYGPPSPDPRSRQHAGSGMSSPSSTAPMQPMQYIDPAPLSDSMHSSIPGAFPVPSPVMTNRPGPVPIQQPQPIAPVLPSLYTSQSSPQPSPLVANPRIYSQPQVPSGFRRTQSSPVTSHFARDATLAGVAAATTAGILSNRNGRNTKEGSPSSNVRFDLTGKQARKEERERRREQDKEGGPQRGEYESFSRDDTAERGRDQRRAMERQAAEEAVKREADAIRELAERAETERRRELERQHFEQEALARRKAEIDAEAARQREDERRRYDAQMSQAAEREADERRRQGESRRQEGGQYDRDAPSRRERSQQQREPGYYAEQDRIDLNENESQDGPSSWKAPATAGIAGATVGAVQAGAMYNRGNDHNDRMLYEARPSGNRDEGFDNDTYDPDYLRHERNESDYAKHADLARKAVAKVVSDLEDRYQDPTPSQASFFAPKELFEPAKGKTKVVDPVGDNNVQVYHVPNIEIDQPSNEPPPPYQPSSEFPVNRDSKPDRMPWGVPKLNVIAPTPPTSHAGSAKGDRSPISPLSDPQEDEVKHHQEEQQEQKEQRDSSTERRRSNRVSWGEDQTRVFEVHTPDSARENFISNQELRDAQNQPRDEIVVETDDHGEESCKTTYKAQEHPQSSDTPEKAHTKDPLLNNDRPYQHPFFESVSDLGFAMDSPGTEGAPPVRGFVEGEVDETTPREERLPHIPGGFDENTPTPPVVDEQSETSFSKKDKKKGKASKRAGVDDSFFPATAEPESEPAQQNIEPEFEIPLSKKEKKKKEKAAKRGLVEDDFSASLAEPEAVQAQPEPEFTVPLSKKEQKKRAKEANERVLTEPAPPRSRLESESWADMMDAEAQPDNQDDFLTKKEKKKRDKAMNRSLGDYDSAPASPALEIETAIQDVAAGAEQERDDDMFLSKKDRKKREKEREKAAKLVLMEEEANLQSPIAKHKENSEPVDDFEVALSKKEQKKREQLARQASLEHDSPPITPLEQPSTVEAAEDFDFPITAKEKKKRAREAKRKGLDGDTAALLASGAVGAVLTALDTNFDNQAERSVRNETQPDSGTNATRNTTEREERGPSASNAAFGDLEALADTKKLKKKSKRNSGAFNSPTVGSPLRSEVAYDDYIGSQFPATSKDDGNEREYDLPKDTREAQLDDRYPSDRSGDQGSPTEARDRKVADFPSSESERDSRSVVSAPVGRDEESRRHKSRKSRHEDDYEPSGRSRSVAASEPADVYESSKKGKRRSKCDSEDFDDAASVISARSSHSKHEDEDSSKKKEKKSGIFGLFRRKSSDSTLKTQGQYLLDTEKDDETKHRKRHHRRRSSERSQYEDAASTTSTLKRHDEDVDDDTRSHRSSGSRHRHRHRDDSDDDLDDSRSQVSESRRKHKHRHRDRSADDDKSRSRDRKHTHDRQNDERDQSFLAERVEDEELPPLPASFPSSPTRAPESVDQQFTSSSIDMDLPGVTESSPVPLNQNQEEPAEVDKSPSSIDEAYVPLPSSRPSSPVGVGSVFDLPPLPASRPLSPSLNDETPKRPLKPNRLSSSTSVPLRFRKPPTSPNTPRERSMSFSSPTAVPSPASPFASPRTRQTRPGSTEFKHSTEFRPLYLVERNSKPQETEQEQQLPSLPSSRTTSRASSFRDSEKFQSAAEDQVSEHDERESSASTHADRKNGHVEDVLGSQQTTPKASSFPAHVLNVRPHAEPEYYSWSDIEREESLRRNNDSAYAQLEPSVSQEQGHDVEIKEEAVQRESPDTQGDIHNLSKGKDHDKDRSSIGSMAAAALTGAAAGLLIHEATTTNDDPMASDVWGDSNDIADEAPAVNEDPLASDIWGDASDRGDNEPSYFNTEPPGSPIERPKEPERPNLSRSVSSKKGKKGKKGKEIKLGTASISEPTTPVAPEELRNRRRQDTQSFVDSWFASAPIETSEIKKKGKKGKSQSIDVSQDRPDEILEIATSSNEPLSASVDEIVPAQSQSEEIAIQAADVALPETPALSAESKLRHSVQDEAALSDHPAEIPLPETPAIRIQEDAEESEKPSASNLTDSQATRTPESTNEPNMTASGEYFPLISRKKSKKGKKKQKQETWDDAATTPSEIPAEGSDATASALDTSTPIPDSTSVTPLASEPREPTLDLQKDMAELPSDQLPLPADADADAADVGAARDLPAQENISRDTTTDQTNENEAHQSATQAAPVMAVARRKKGKKGRKLDPWSDGPVEEIVLPSNEVVTPTLEETPQSQEAEPDFFQATKKGKKSKMKQKVDIWADEPASTQAVEPSAVEQTEPIQNEDVELAPEAIALPRTSDEDSIEQFPSTQGPSTDEDASTADMPLEQTSEIGHVADEIEPLQGDLQNDTDRGIDEPTAVATSQSAEETPLPVETPLEQEKDLQTGHSETTTASPILLERNTEDTISSAVEGLHGSTTLSSKETSTNAEKSSIDDTPTPAQEDESSWFSWLPGSKKKKSKKSMANADLLDESTTLPQEPAREDDRETAPSQSVHKSSSELSKDHAEADLGSTMLPAETELPQQLEAETTSLYEPENTISPSQPEALLETTQDQQAILENAPLPIDNTTRDQASAENETVEPNADDEWASFSTKKSKKGRKGNQGATALPLTSEPHNIPQEVEQPVPADVPLPIEERSSLSPEYIALPVEEQSTEVIPGDVALPSENQSTSPELIEKTTMDSVDPRDVSQPIEPEPQDEFWAPTKKLKKGKKARKGIDSPAEQTEEPRQEETPPEQATPGPEKSEPVEAEDFWSLPTKKSKKAKKAKKVADAIEGFDNDNDESEQSRSQELRETPLLDIVQAKSFTDQTVGFPAEPEAENAAEPAAEAEPEDEWAVPSKKSKKSKKGKKSDISTPQVLEEPGASFEVAAASGEALAMSEEKEETLELTPASGDNAPVPTDSWIVSNTKKDKKGKKGKKSVLTEPELESSRDNVDPVRTSIVETMEVPAPKQDDMWAAPKSKKDKKSKRKSASSYEEPAEPSAGEDQACDIVSDDQTAITKSAECQDATFVTQGGEEPTQPAKTDISGTGEERASQEQETPVSSAVTTNDTTERQDENLEAEDVFATPLAERQTAFETPVTETPEESFVTPFEPQTPTPTTCEHFASEMRSQSPVSTRRTSYFGRGATYNPSLDNSTTEESSEALLTPTQVPLPEGNDLTPTAVSEERFRETGNSTDRLGRTESDPIQAKVARPTVEEDITADKMFIPEDASAPVDELTDEAVPSDVSHEESYNEMQAIQHHSTESMPVPDVAAETPDELTPAGEDEWASGFSLKKSKKEKKMSKKAKAQDQDLESFDNTNTISAMTVREVVDDAEPKVDETQIPEPEQDSVHNPIQEPNPETIREPIQEPVKHEALDDQVFPVKLSKKDKKKAKKTASARDDSWEMGQEQGPNLGDNVSHKQDQESSTISQPTLEPNASTKVPQVQPESVMPATQSKKDKKKGKKAKAWDDAWSSEALETPVAEQKIPISSEQDVPDNSFPNESAQSGSLDTREVPKEEDEADFTLLPKASKKDKKKAKKTMAWEEWPSDTAKAVPQDEPHNSTTSQDPLEQQTATKDPITEAIEIPIEKAELTPPAKLSKKDKKKAKKTKAWEEWPDEENLETPIEEPPKILAAEPELTSEHLATSAEVPPKVESQAIQTIAEHTPLPETQPEPSPDLSADTEHAIQELTTVETSRDIRAEVVQKIAEDTPLPEPEFEIPTKQSKKDKKKKKSKAWEEWPSEEVQAQEFQESSQDVIAEPQPAVNETSPEDSPETLRSVAKETPLPEPEVEMPAKLSEKDKKKKKSGVWEEWPSEEAQVQEVQEPSQEAVAEPEPDPATEESAAKGITSDDSLEIIQTIAKEIPLPEPETEMPIKLSRKDKKEKKSKAWEEWPSEETRVQEVQEPSQVVFMEPESTTQQLAVKETAMGHDPETVQAVAEQTPLPEPEFELPFKLKKDKKKAKKSNAWEDPWPSQETKEKLFEDTPPETVLEANETISHPAVSADDPEHVQQIAEETPLPEPEFEIPAKQSKKEKRKGKKGKAVLWDDVPEPIDESGATPPIITSHQESTLPGLKPVEENENLEDENITLVMNTDTVPDTEAPKDSWVEPEESFTTAPTSKKNKKEKKKSKKNAFAWEETDSLPQSPAARENQLKPMSPHAAPIVDGESAKEITQEPQDHISRAVAHEPVQLDQKELSQQAPDFLTRSPELQYEPANGRHQDFDRGIDNTMAADYQAQDQHAAIEVSEQPKQDIDFAATLAAGLQGSGFDPNLVVDDPVFHRRASPPGQAEADPEEFFSATKKGKKGKGKAGKSVESSQPTPGEERAEQGSEKEPNPNIINEKTAEDDDFSATLTAGLAASGFAANVLQDSRSDRRALAEEPEEFSFAISRKRKGKKDKTSLPLTPDVSEPARKLAIETYADPAQRYLDKTPIQTPYHEAAAVEDPEPIALMQGDFFLPQPWELGVPAFEPERIESSTVHDPAIHEQPREVPEPSAEDEWALPVKKGKKSKKKGVAWQPVEEEQVAAEKSAAEVPRETQNKTGLLQSQWLQDMIPDVLKASPAEEEPAPIASDEAVKEISPEDKFMEEAFGGFSSKKRKSKKDKKKLVLEERPTEEAKERQQSDVMQDTLDQENATQHERTEDVTPFEHPRYGQPINQERGTNPPSSEDAISPTSKVASIFPGLQRVKRRTTSTASREPGESKQGDPSASVRHDFSEEADVSRSLPVAAHNVETSRDEGTHRMSDHRQSGTFTPIEMDTPTGGQQQEMGLAAAAVALAGASGALSPKAGRTNDETQESRRNAKDLITNQPIWSFANLRDSGVPSLDSPIQPGTPLTRDTVRDSGYNDDPPEEQIVDPRRSGRTQSPDDSLRVSIELNPGWNIPVSKQRSPRKKGRSIHREVNESIEEESRQVGNGRPSPVYSTTKDRTSYLFSSPPGVHNGPASGSTHAPAAPTNLFIPEGAGQDDRTGYFASTPGEVIRQPTSPARLPQNVEMPIHFQDEPLARKKSRDISDVGSPEQGVKSARRTATPLQSFRERINSASQDQAELEGRPYARDEVGSQVSWPGIEEEPENGHGRGLRTDTRRTLGDLRSASALSNRPTSSGSHSIRTQDQFRSSSATSNRSTTPSLRRIDRSMSGDLRAASRRRGDAPGPKTITIEPPPTPPLQEGDDNGFDGSGDARTPDMSNVYEGWGDVRGSSMSPTRPPSVRKRQSMHISDLQTQLDQLVAENRRLEEANNNVEQSHREISQQYDADGQALQVEIEDRDEQLREKDDELQQLQAMIAPLQQEIVRLTEINGELTETKRNLVADTNNRYASMQREHAQTRQQWEQSNRELDNLRQQHSELTGGMEDIVRKEIAIALRDKNAEIRKLREELEMATQQIRTLQSQILSSKTDNYLSAHDEDYFDTSCQKLCQHVQQWVLRFSKYSDNRMCRLTSDLADEKIEARLDNAILDGSDVDKLLGDRVRRRDVFMSLVMGMIWEYVFTRYLFGMDREQRQKLKALEKILQEVGPPRAVAHWRATTLTLLSRRPAFATQRNLDTEAVAQEIFAVLSTLLPPPSQLESQILASLRNVLRLAVDLAVEMRTQRAEYIMLPPLQPEYDAHGDLVRKVHFNAALMNERSGEYSSNDELERNQAVVKMVLFPLVVKKGNDEGEGEDEIVVCPAQVLVAGAKTGKKVVRVLSGAMEIDEPRRSKQSLLSGYDGGSGNMI